MNTNIIPIAMISDDNFIMPTCVAITSMIVNKSPESFYDIYVVMAECNEESEHRISSLNRADVKVNIVKAVLDEYKDIKQLAHISIACLLKFDICDLIPRYDKILYLDGDIIVRSDLSELYDNDVSNKYAGAVKELSCVEEDTGNINAGIMLFNAKRIREEKLREKLVETRRKLGDRGSMDQQSFNIVTNKEYKYLPIKYNCVMAKLVGKGKIETYTIDKLNTLYGSDYKNNNDLVENAIIIHFATSNKPWDYTFNAGAQEWYSYYMQSPYKNVPFELKGIWKYRFDKMKEAYEIDGIRGIANRMTDKISRTFKKEKKIDWE